MTLRSLLLLFMFCVPLVSQRTIVVDRRGGGDFTNLDAAVADADPGDTVIVRRGFYPNLRLEKGINVLGDPEAGESTAVVVHLWEQGLVGASIGDSEAWLVEQGSLN